MLFLYMNDGDRSIIATLAYYAAFSWPLTAMEVYQRLIPASRLGGRRAGVSLALILERLDRLVVMGVVVHENGLYTLAGGESGFADRRVEQEKIWAQKWRRMVRRAWWLQSVPFIRGMHAGGSLALGNMSKGSDWDIFVVARAGRLYTARAGLLLVAWLMRALRTKHDRSAADKFCFNHYVTTDGLVVRHRSMYVAHGLALLVPIADFWGYLERLWQANQWIGDYRPLPTNATFVRRSVTPSRMLMVIQWGVEKILLTPFGSFLERVLKKWQQRRIRRTPATYERGGRVAATDRELEFHPRSFEAIALQRYNGALSRYHLGSWAERDSGLTR